MRVLQIGKFYPVRGGVEKVMYDLMLGLADRAVACDMLCATTEEHRGGEISFGPYAKLFAIKTQIKFAATMIAPKMVTRLRQIADSYDIIHIHHPDPMACLALYASGFKGKVILHWHSDILKQKILLKLYGPLQQWLIRRADIIVGTTPVYVQSSPFLGKVQNKVDFIPIGIQAMSPQIQLVDRLRKKYKDKFLVFSLGRLVEYKGYEYLVRAAQHLDDRFQIVIGGKGPLETRLIELINECDVQKRVELVGYISDEELPGYYGACDVFCLSSIMKSEAFAIVQIEAMSCGKPVISTRIPGSGVSWVNADGKSGLVVDIEDAKGLANAIRMTADDKKKYKLLSEGALNRYSSNFTRERMVDRCLELYNRVLNPELRMVKNKLLPIEYTR